MRRKYDVLCVWALLELSSVKWIQEVAGEIVVCLLSHGNRSRVANAKSQKMDGAFPFPNIA